MHSGLVYYKKEMELGGQLWATVWWEFICCDVTKSLIIANLIRILHAFQ